MPSWLTRFLSSSLGKKSLMALTGLALIGFLIVHLAGNLSLYTDADGTAFNAYAHEIESLGPLLWVAELGLLALIVVHVGLALKVWQEGREARGPGYRVRATMGNKTVPSSSMIVTGLIVAVFLVIHLTDFRIPKLLGVEGADDLAGAVKRRLGSPTGATIYVVGVTALGIHLAHGFQSAFQTLGIEHPRYTPLIRAFGLVLTVVLFLGFVSFPILLLARAGGAN